MARQFHRTGGLRPSRTAFNLTHSRMSCCDLGELVPICCEQMNTGDTFIINFEHVARFHPLITPLMHEINLFTHWFFVPNRLLMDIQNNLFGPGYNVANYPSQNVSDWELFISGGVDGTGRAWNNLPSALPRWNPTPQDLTLYSLWDYFCFPVVLDQIPPVNSPRLPVAFPKRAYNLVFNENFRDQELQERVDWNQRAVLRRNWAKDYYTSALLERQRGPNLAIPLYTGALPIVESGQTVTVPTSGSRALRMANAGPVFSRAYMGPLDNTDAATHQSGIAAMGAIQGSFDWHDIREIAQVTKWMERNQRAGVRYTEFLNAHFGVSPRDERLMRPEYIGGTKSPINICEVLNTSTGAGSGAPTPLGVSPQGNMSGHGLCASDGYVGTYKAYEYGILIGIMSIMPETVYEDGIDRQWLQQTRFDYYFPEFAHLSEQGVFNGEVFYTGTPADMNIFGFQGRYDEYRWRASRVSGEFRTKVSQGFQTLSYWHLARSFDVPPSLNESFIMSRPDTDRVVAVRGVKPIMYNVRNKIKAIRAMPAMAEPGNIDHY